MNFIKFTLVTVAIVTITAVSSNPGPYTNNLCQFS